jgi:hypothetical protein
LADILRERYPDGGPKPWSTWTSSITEFQEMKMQPSLERALRHRDILKA